MDIIRKIARRIVYSIEFRPWTPAEKRAYKAISGLNSMPKSLALQYKKRKHKPQLFLAQLHMEMRQLVSVDWYQDRYISLIPVGVKPEDYFVDFGFALGHMPNEYIDLDNDVIFEEPYWKPATIAEFLLRSDWKTANIGTIFSPGAYLDLYPDINKGIINPLIHYVQHGRLEGRLSSSAELMNGDGTISYKQLFNKETKLSEWINIRGSISDLDTSSIELFLNSQKIGNARLGIPEIRVGWGKKYELLGFQYSSELKFDNAGGVLFVQSVSFSGERKTLCEISLLSEEQKVEKSIISQFSPSSLSNSHQKLQNETIQVLVITHHLGIGGGQLYLQEILRGFSSADDVKITLISMVGGVLEEELQELGIDCYIFPGPKPFSRNAYEQFLWDFDELLSGHEFDLFIANTTGCFAQVDWCLRNNIEGYWAIHESYTRQGWARAAYGRDIDPYAFERLEYTLKNTKVLVFEAQGTLDIVMSGLPQNNSEIVKYGIDIPQEKLNWKKNQVSSTPRKQRVLKLVCVGTFEERKAQGLIVLLAKHLKDIGKNVEFDLIGYKPGDHYSDSVYKAVVDLQLEAIVRLHGITSDWQSKLEDADFFFMPSDVESMPQSMMIAMSYGVPAIGSRVFGIPELITDGFTGFIHDPNDIADMTRVIFKALEISDEEYLKMRDSAREFIISNHEKSDYVNYFLQKVLESKKK